MARWPTFTKTQPTAAENSYVPGTRDCEERGPRVHNDCGALWWGTEVRVCIEVPAAAAMVMAHDIEHEMAHEVAMCTPATYASARNGPYSFPVSNT